MTKTPKPMGFFNRRRIEKKNRRTLKAICRNKEIEAAIAVTAARNRGQRVSVLLN